MIPSSYSAIMGFSHAIPLRNFTVNFQSRMIESIEDISFDNMFKVAKIVGAIAVVLFSAVVLMKGFYWLFFQSHAEKIESEEDSVYGLGVQSLFPNSPLKSPKNLQEQTIVSLQREQKENAAKKEGHPAHSEVLFEIKKENLDTGLRGYPIGYCATSQVDPIKGLFYVGHPVSEIDQWEPENVIYLLYHGKEGTEEDIAEFSKNLIDRAPCSKELITHIEHMPKQGHPMKLFIDALLLTGIFEGKNQYREDCLNLIAKVPEIAATVINHHAGWEMIETSHPELGYIENFTQMLNVPNASFEKLNRAFKLFNILHYDHGGGNLSTFIGKAVASSLEDLYGSIVAAMCALAGPRHGKANQDCLNFVQSLVDDLGDNAKEEDVEAILRKKLAKNELIYGFGHAVLRVEDPRATLLYDISQRDYPDHPLVKMAHLLRKVGPKILKENPKISNPYPNVDAISGVLLSAAGFHYPEYYTILFGLSRIVGIARQIVYEREEARNGKGTPIVRPKYLYQPRALEGLT